MPSPLSVYLRNHEAAGQAGYDLARRIADSHRRQPYSGDLDQLVRDISADLKSLREVLRRYRVHPDPKLALALRFGERVGRLKPNGAVLRRAPLTDLIEIEGMLDAVRAKGAGWQALAAAATDPVDVAAYQALLGRANSQASMLIGVHQQVSAKVLDLS